MDSFYAAKGDEEESRQEHERERLSSRPTSAAGISSGHQTAGSSARNSPHPVSGTSKSAEKPKFRSFSELVRGNSDDEDEQRNTFAGGETSGLEVSDPNDSNSLIRDLLEKAKRGGQQPPTEDNDEEHARKNFFTGKGYRLGSSVDAAPQVVEDIPEEPLPSRPRKVTRDITFWKEGFQVGDGELYRYDDPANSYYLNELNQGRAPLRLLDVEFGQEVDVNVYKKLDESYRPPKRKAGGFTGTGQRLGSPVPGESLSPEAVVEKSPEVEQSQQPEPTGDTSVQIRYTNGKREILRCNSTDTIRYLYDYVKKNSEGSRPFTLNHAFPVKPIENFDATIKDEGLCNAVVVQRWV